MSYMQHPVTMTLDYYTVSAGGDSVRISRTLILKEVSQHDVGLRVTSMTDPPHVLLTCLNVKRGLSLAALLWPRWLEEARAMGGDGDLGHDAGDAGLVGLSHI